MADDIVTDVEGLRLIAWSLEGGNVKMADECRRAADEIERLRRWKSEATTVIENWEAVWDAAGSPGVLGQSKSLGLLGELGRLVAWFEPDAGRQIAGRSGDNVQEARREQ